MSTVSTSSLVERLRADGKLPAGWAAAVNAVSRERFAGRFDVRQYGHAGSGMRPKPPTAGGNAPENHRSKRGN